jgi:hypothetical protein
VIPRHVRAATDLLQAPGGKGIEYFLARMGGEAGDLSIRHRVRERAHPLIERIREKIDVSNPGIVHLWRRNQNVVGHNRLHGFGRVEVGSHYHLSR